MARRILKHHDGPSMEDTTAEGVEDGLEELLRGTEKHGCGKVLELAALKVRRFG
jgi:hypothetical protein